MLDGVDANEAVWKSEETVKRWASEAAVREKQREEQFRFMAALLPFAEGDAFTVVDLGAGTGVASRAILDFYPQATAILADFSPQMMGAGLEVLQPYVGRYRYVEFDMRTPEWPAAIPVPLEAVVTSQSIHHLPDDRKQGLFQEIFERLLPGAWYVNFDPVRASNEDVERTWQRVNDRLDPAAADRRNHRHPQEQAQWENHVRHMIDLDRHMGFFRSAGFEAVDVYWKRLDYVIYGGRKPA